jgi:hypothetical protein
MTEKLDTSERRGGDAATSTPLRRPHSLRRTTTHDCRRRDGLSGPVILSARGRDLYTAADGRAQVIDAVRLEAAAEALHGPITAITAEPSHPGLAAVVGVSVLGGFRSAVDKALPEEAASHAVRSQLLDDLPAAILGSGRALRAAGIGIVRSSRPPPVDLCAGWAAGGTLLAGLDDFGPPFHIGPPAPDVLPEDDPVAWHEVEPLPQHGTRRARRLDVWREDGKTWADCFFRDSHVDGEGVERVVHEWSVRAELDPRTRTFVSSATRTGPLPYPECPGAGASATRLAGMPFDGLRRAVRKTFTGPSTCTHLNDTLRSMEDVGTLIDMLQARVDAEAQA